MKFAYQNVYSFAPNCSITRNNYDTLAPLNISPSNTFENQVFFLKPEASLLSHKNYNKISNVNIPGVSESFCAANNLS